MDSVSLDRLDCCCSQVGCRGLAGGGIFDDEEGPLVSGGGEAPGRVGLGGAVDVPPPQRTKSRDLCCGIKKFRRRGKDDFLITSSFTE